MSNSRLAEFRLDQIEPFSLLSDEKIQILRRAARHRRYERGCTILPSGNCPTGVYVLLAGRAKAVIEDAQGRAMTLSVIKTNELFGSIGLYDEGVRWTAVKALHACEALHIPRPVFLECIDGNYAAALVILRLAETRLHNAELKVARLGLLDVYERVARLFIESAEQVTGQWIVETGAEEIARTVAASREMVSRVVKNMRQKGLVRRDKRRTVILDWQSMSAACPL